jgi:hypothetical protein
VTQRLDIIVPCLDGVQSDHVSCLLATVKDLQPRGWEARVDYHVGDAMISRARNAMAARFLASPADALLMVDSDILFPSHAVWQLLQWNVPVVGFNCRHRVPEVRWASLAESADETLSRAILLGTGMMLIRRRALEGLIETKRKDPRFNLDSYVDDEGQRTWGFFIPYISMTPQRGYLSEDWAFCARLRAANIDVFIDNTIRPRHVGRHVFG